MIKPKFSRKEKVVVNSNSKIINGKFPLSESIYEKPAILKLNKILSVSLLIVAILAMVSYMGVVMKESSVQELHSATNKVNYENIELQNKVDYLKSFYTLDDKVQKMDFLKKPDQVIEVKPSEKSPIIIEKKKWFDETPLPGF